MRIVIPGGTGQVGTVLARAFARDGHNVVVLSRGHQSEGSGRVAYWDATSLGQWVSEFEDADVIINLAGRNVNCRYTRLNRQAIMDSRVNSTKVVGTAIAQCKRPPRVWLQASTATIYSHRFDEPNDEATGILGSAETDTPDTWRFSLTVATAWEHAAKAINPRFTRTVLLRTAIVMNPDRGGAFDALLRLVRMGFGGRSGSGRQYVSWIHEADFIRAIYWAIENPSIQGPLNLASPNPVPNEEFMRRLREAWGIGFGIPSPDWLLEMGALFIRTETELLLKSRRVLPGILMRQGFDFEFPAWREAARDLCRRWRELKDAKPR